MSDEVESYGLDPNDRLDPSIGPDNYDPNDPFHPDNVGKVQLIVQLRIYDALMAILANMNEDGEKAANFIHEQHQLGKIVGSLPWLDLSDES